MNLIPIKIFAKNTICGADFDEKEYTIYINLNYIVYLSDLQVFRLPISGSTKGQYASVKLTDSSIFFIKKDEYNKILSLTTTKL